MSLTGAALARSEVPPPLPGPGPRPHDVPVNGLGKMASNGSCVGCHQEIGREWARSLHKQAWVDPVFQEAYRVEPIAFCRRCHAPESNPAAEPTLAAKEIGVGCVSCHVESSHVVGVRAASSKSLHPVLADPRLATPAACASCHQFNFPADAHQLVAVPMQDTVGEHARSSAAATPCQSCHMPRVTTAEGTHRSHAFSVLADPAMIRRAVTVIAARPSEKRVDVTLAAASIGHAFPTGDMFRRLEVRAELLDDKGQVTAAAEPLVLGRSFRDEPRDPAGLDLTFMRVPAEDNRVPPPGAGPVVVTLELPRNARPAERVRWRVVYQRMSTPMAEAFHVSQVLDEIVVAEGEISTHKIANNNTTSNGGGAR